jgi:hypothetical protein
LQQSLLLAQVAFAVPQGGGAIAWQTLLALQMVPVQQFALLVHDWPAAEQPSCSQTPLWHQLLLQQFALLVQLAPVCWQA